MSQQGDSRFKVYSLPNKNIFVVIKLMDTNWAGHILRMGKTQKIFKFNRRRHLGNLNKIHLESICVFIINIIIFIITHYFLLHVSTHLSHHQGEPSAGENVHENVIVYPHYSV